MRQHFPWMIEYRAGMQQRIEVENVVVVGRMFSSIPSDEYRRRASINARHS
jgi:hypothetical protein